MCGCMCVKNCRSNCIYKVNSRPFASLSNIHLVREYVLRDKITSYKDYKTRTNF